MDEPRVVTVEIPEELAVEAEASGLDLARACRDGLWFMMRKRRRDAAWADEHREQIEAWNEWLETHGLPFERFRAF
jgi:post-segregation antitoxin (ccd killing protein)